MTRRLGFILSVIIAFSCSKEAPPKNPFPDFRKISCINSEAGCPCRSDAGVVTVYHAQSAVTTGKKIETDSEIEIDGKKCFYPESKLIKMDYTKVLHHPLQETSHAPLDLSKLLGQSENVLETSDRQDLGSFWGTFYHLALEEFYPGKDTPILSPDGHVLGHASENFLREVTWEGSGVSRSGMRLQYAGPGRYTTYSSAVWGYGAGRKYQIFPYRTIAVNFPGICKKLTGMIPGCTSGEIPGLMVYIPEIAEKKIRMQDGKFHDGYFCMTDTGAPYYIRSDRVDFFVGVHGGGNPFLPEERRNNDMISGGFEPLLPSDWRLWTGLNNRVWCPPERIPRDLHAPSSDDCLHDYHTVARKKSFHMLAMFSGDGKPIRCRGGI